MNDTPAFPTTLFEHGGESNGMTLRDYFAAKAMQGLIKYGPWSDYVDMEQIAKLAYKQADAMMAARSAE
jgi:hypothetical protein